MEAQWKIEQWVYEQAQTSTGAFYSSAPAKELALDEKLVFSTLLSFVKDGKLEIEFEIRCPDCFATVFRGIRSKIPQEFYCDRCDARYITMEEDIIPYFRFTTRFKDHAQGSTSKKLGRMIRTKVEDDIIRQRFLVVSHP